MNLTSLIIAALVLLLVLAVVWWRASRKAPPDPEAQDRLAEMAAEARALRASTEEMARRLRRDRAQNHYSDRLRAAYQEGRR